MIRMRIIQQIDPSKEGEFLALEKEFAALEKRRSDYPKGIRYKPLASTLSVNTLIWECDFENLNEAHQALKFLGSDPDHQALAEKQSPFFKDVRIEFLEKM